MTNKRAEFPTHSFQVRFVVSLLSLDSSSSRLHFRFCFLQPWLPSFKDCNLRGLSSVYFWEICSKGTSLHSWCYFFSKHSSSPTAPLLLRKPSNPPVKVENARLFTLIEEASQRSTSSLKYLPSIVQSIASICYSTSFSLIFVSVLRRLGMCSAVNSRNYMYPYSQHALIVSCVEREHYRDILLECFMDWLTLNLIFICLHLTQYKSISTLLSLESGVFDKLFVCFRHYCHSFTNVVLRISVFLLGFLIQIFHRSHPPRSFDDGSWFEFFIENFFLIVIASGGRVRGSMNLKDFRGFAGIKSEENSDSQRAKPDRKWFTKTIFCWWQIIQPTHLCPYHFSQESDVSVSQVALSSIFGVFYICWGCCTMFLVTSWRRWSVSSSLDNEL